jgi:uncharacterized protein YceK
MKLLIFAGIIIIPLLLPSCFTLMTLSSMQTQGYTTFYPDSIWLSNDGRTFAFLGWVSNDKNKMVSHILIPRNDLARLGTNKGVVAVSDLARVSISSERVLKIQNGSILKGFSKVGGVTKGDSHVSIKTVTPSNPGAILLLPVTIIVDAVTLPVQIPVINSMSKIH